MKKIIFLYILYRFDVFRYEKFFEKQPQPRFQTDNK